MLAKLKILTLSDGFGRIKTPNSCRISANESMFALLVRGFRNFKSRYVWYASWVEIFTVEAIFYFKLAVQNHKI